MNDNSKSNLSALNVNSVKWLNSDQNVLGKQISVNSKNVDLLAKQLPVEENITSENVQFEQPLSIPNDTPIPPVDAVPVEINPEIAELGKPNDITQMPAQVLDSMRNVIPEPQPIGEVVDVSSNEFNLPLPTQENEKVLEPKSEKVELDIPVMEAVTPVVNEAVQETVIPVGEPISNETVSNIPVQETVVPEKVPVSTEPVQETIVPAGIPVSNTPVQETVVPAGIPVSTEPEQEIVVPVLPMQESFDTPVLPQTQIDNDVIEKYFEEFERKVLSELKVLKEKIRSLDDSKDIETVIKDGSEKIESAVAVPKESLAFTIPVINNEVQSSENDSLGIGL